MQYLEINEKQARSFYPNVSGELKDLFDNHFGADFFKRTIIDRVKTFEDACNIVGANPHSPDFYPACDTKDEIAYKKIKVIVCALNEGWGPNWNDSTQKKYAPMFECRNGFQYNQINYCYAVAETPTRLCFKSSELAMYAAKQFQTLYEQYFK